VILRHYWSGIRTLSPMRRLHYSLLMSYYPSAALLWLLLTARAGGRGGSGHPTPRGDNDRKCLAGESYVKKPDGSRTRS